MEFCIILPAYNEEATIQATIKGFQAELPQAKIYVVDNASSDQTNEIAKRTLGASFVLYEGRPGKANALRKAFTEIQADVYIVADADLTYPAKDVHRLIAPIVNGEADIVVGDRLSNGTYASENKRSFHQFGNNLVLGAINFVFQSQLCDVMSGYRVMSKRFVKTFPILTQGFEIETEMTLHTLHKRFRLKEIPITYQDRPVGSESKLNTYSDGFKVLLIIFTILKDYKPLTFFGSFSILFGLLGLILGLPVVLEFIATAYITKVPSAILATGLMVFSIVAAAIGLILHTITRFHQLEYELKVINFE